MGFEWLASKNYKRHYICLDCQKGFKRASKEDMKHPKLSDFSDLMEVYYTSASEQNIVEFIQDSYRNSKFICPQCQASMVQVAYTFEVPRHRDQKAWKGLKARFHDKTIPNYDPYIQWHHRNIKAAPKNSPELKILQENLRKLEKVNQ